MSALAVRVLVDVVFLIIVARCVPWTRSAVVAWLLTGLVLLATDLAHIPVALRVATIVLPAAWLVIIFYPDWSPFGPLSGAERRFDRVVRRVSDGARAAYQAGTLDAQRATFIADLEALDPPNEPWRIVKAAQLVDLLADPPQVGVDRDTSRRLALWPWQVALDHRLIGLQLWVRDAIRARRLRPDSRPGYLEMPSVMRYDRFFLRILVARLEAVKEREGGMARWREEAAALLALGGDVRAPNATWVRQRDLVLEVYALELQDALGDLTAVERERVFVAADEASRYWAGLYQRGAGNPGSKS